MSPDVAAPWQKLVAPVTVHLWDRIAQIRREGGPGAQARVNAAVLASHRECGGVGVTAIHALYATLGGGCCLCQGTVDWAVPTPDLRRLLVVNRIVKGSRVKRIAHAGCAKSLPETKRKIRAQVHPKALAKRTLPPIERVPSMPAPRLLEQIGERDQWKCWLCERPVDRALRVPDRLAPTLDHVTPKSKGGGNAQSNLRLAHNQCNRIRGNCEPEDGPRLVRSRLGREEEAREDALDSAQADAWRAA